MRKPAGNRVKIVWADGKEQWGVAVFHWLKLWTGSGWEWVWAGSK